MQVFVYISNPSKKQTSNPMSKFSHATIILGKLTWLSTGKIMPLLIDTTLG